jgi:hypothetical protein
VAEGHADAVRKTDSVWSAPGDYTLVDPERYNMEIEGQIVPFKKVKAIPVVRDSRLILRTAPSSRLPSLAVKTSRLAD